MKRDGPGRDEMNVSSPDATCYTTDSTYDFGHRPALLPLPRYYTSYDFGGRTVMVPRTNSTGTVTMSDSRDGENASDAESSTSRKSNSSPPEPHLNVYI